jgi:hypothetical protein
MEDMNGMTRQEWLNANKAKNTEKFQKLVKWHEDLKERTPEEKEKYKKISEEGWFKF